MIDKIVKEMVWVRIRTMFTMYLDRHVNSLPTEVEKETFLKLINNDDEWSQQILQNLWNKFEEKELSEGVIQRMTNEVLELLNKTAEI